MKFDLVMPILGFDDIKQVELEKIDDIFMRMKACENEHISFTLINPFVLREYDFEISENIKEKIEIDTHSNIIILNIVLIQTPIENSTVNFIAPLIFNTDNKKAIQIVIDTNQYGVAEPISSFLKSS